MEVYHRGWLRINTQAQETKACLCHVIPVQRVPAAASLEPRPLTMRPTDIISSGKINISQLRSFWLRIIALAFPKNANDDRF